MSFVIRNGRRIEVETVAIGVTPNIRRRAPFVVLPLSWAAEASAATNCQKAMVWVWLVHRMRTTKSTTVTMPNRVLAKYGVSRRVKSSALRQLEEAGLITVERRPRKTPVVTLLQL
jgi:DNA-binding transcriptional ArsR family regulator